MSMDPSRFAGLDYEGFRRLASDAALTPSEKVGFPDAYRVGFEALILDDIERKLPALSRRGAAIVDIGCGCSELTSMFMASARERSQSLTLIDSPEMLAQLPDVGHATLVPAFFPHCPEWIEAMRGRADAVVVYSVLQYVFTDTSPWLFLDAALSLLAPGGGLLLGDVPNVSMRARFLRSDAGRAFHHAFTGRSEEPPPQPAPPGCIDDSAVLALLARARAAGFHGYVMPQGSGLPMANRREDIVIYRP